MVLLPGQFPLSPAPGRNPRLSSYLSSPCLAHAHRRTTGRHTPVHGVRRVNLCSASVMLYPGGVEARSSLQRITFIVHPHPTTRPTPAGGREG